ncbi:unnamed protein product [Cuscuta campestris]|uniref:Helitron helicase-like domain-containing protein n=1 Tax=Cuscuta campestris TaxID=132261 RepID=A0A484LWS5_9ASTE|nr:unnamed protein product [Cuscuta campestris]
MEENEQHQRIQTATEARKRRKLIIDQKRQTTLPSNSTGHRNTTLQKKQGRPSEAPQETHTTSEESGESKYLTLSNPTERCNHCDAIMWKEERNNSRYPNRPPTFSLCCMEGRINLEALKHAPEYLRDLLNYSGGKRSKTFRDNIRAYNSMFASTSIGADIDYEINKSKGPYVFRISGQNCHQIGSLMPQSNKPHKFLQLYMYDDQCSEVHSRMNSLTKDKPESKLDPDIVAGILRMLDKENCLAQVFRMARDRIKIDKEQNYQLHLLSDRPQRHRQYNAPTASEIAALIVGDFGQGTDGRDIIVQHKEKGLQNISERHPSFMSLQYPSFSHTGKMAIMKRYHTNRIPD